MPRGLLIVEAVAWAAWCLAALVAAACAGLGGSGAGELLDGTGALAARLERWLALTFWAPCAATLFPVAICGLRRRFRAAVLALAAPVAGLIATAVLGVLLLLVLGGWRLFFGAAPS